MWLQYLMGWLRRLPLQSLRRWWLVGLCFFAFGSAILYVFRGVFHVSLIAATFISAEITIILRFGINDRWVFGHRRPTFIRLWQFHVASAGGASIWWAVSNILPRFGIHYLIASTAGTACSVFFSMFTNFLWIWRHRGKAEMAPASTESVADASHGK